MGVTEKIRHLNLSINEVESANSDEASFRALCDYLKIYQRDFELSVLLQDCFDSNHGIYFQAGEALFSLLGSKENTPSSLWSEAQKTLLGGRNKALTVFTKPGSSQSVARTIHTSVTEILSCKEVDEKVVLVLDHERGAVFVKDDPLRIYKVKSRGVGNDKKRFKIIQALNKTSKWLSIKELANATGASDEPTTLKQIKGVNEQFRKGTGLERDLIVRKLKDKKYTYQLNQDRYLFSEKPTGS